ncbi:MAG: FliA/WhiG family RNA polymerase sigma factor [Deltaproteobacteria bacterium]|jgi:RNA polymerase sigma factor FliA|nr:FliA/WhiG family RNA polymerase sigma factor [Deltaproteobacteria bacterium]
MQNPYTKQTEINKEEMVLQYAPSVKYIAGRLSARLPSGIQVDDLIQAGMIGLLEAVDKFDPKKGVKFKTYADFRVRGAMLDDLRSKDWIPRSVRDNGNKLEKAYIELRSQDIDYPTDKQLAKQLELKPKELSGFLEKSRPIPLISLEDVNARGKDEDALDILETLSNPDETDPVEQLLGQESKELLIKAIDKLPENEKMVLSLYYNEDLNLKEIGAVLGLTESRVSQIRTKAIGMLRSYMKSYIEET